MNSFKRTFGLTLGTVALVALVGCAHGPTEIDRHWGTSQPVLTKQMTDGGKDAETPDLDPITAEAAMGRYGRKQSEAAPTGPRPTIINVGPR